MSELQEVTTTELEDKINPNNDSIILSEKENDSDIDSDLDDDDFDFPGDENIPIIPERPPIGSENTVIENNDPDNNMVYERDEIESDNESEKSDESKKDTENENNAPENVVISTETAANSFIASEDEDDTDSGDEEEEDNETFQKLEQDLDRDVRLEYHPEAKFSSYNEVLAQCKIIRNKNGEIIDELHTTIPFLTKYENARILGLRAKQINNGSEPFINIPNNIIDGVIIAEMELKEKKIPFIIRRPIPIGGSEYWKVEDLEVLDA